MLLGYSEYRHPSSMCSNYNVFPHLRTKSSEPTWHYLGFPNLFSKINRTSLLVYLIIPRVWTKNRYVISSFRYPKLVSFIYQLCFAGIKECLSKQLHSYICLIVAKASVYSRIFYNHWLWWSRISWQCDHVSEKDVHIMAHGKQVIWGKICPTIQWFTSSNQNPLPKDQFIQELIIWVIVYGKNFYDSITCQYVQSLGIRSLTYEPLSTLHIPATTV